MTDVPDPLQPTIPTSAAPRSASPTTTGPRLLVIEDDPFSRDMLVRRLAARRFEVSSAADGTSGLALVSGASGPGGPCGGLPDLVLLDVNLPDMSGLEVLRRLRASHSHDALPVILVTALGESSDVIAGLEAGANDYVVKPVNLPVLLARIGVWLTVRQHVALLMEAERDRVMLETLGGACEQLAQPMTAMTVLLEMLTRRPPTDPEELRGELSQVLAVTREAGALIHRLREVARSRSVPYTRRIRMVDRPV
jgi:two-component system sensor histidine kinase ChiS